MAEPIIPQLVAEGCRWNQVIVNVAGLIREKFLVFFREGSKDTSKNPRLNVFDLIPLDPCDGVVAQSSNCGKGGYASPAKPFSEVPEPGAKRGFGKVWKTDVG